MMSLGDEPLGSWGRPEVPPYESERMEDRVDSKHSVSCVVRTETNFRRSEVHN